MSFDGNPDFLDWTSGNELFVISKTEMNRCCETEMNQVLYSIDFYTQTEMNRILYSTYILRLTLNTGKLNT